MMSEAAGQKKDVSVSVDRLTYLKRITVFGGVSKSMLKKSRLNFDKIEKCK